MYNYYGNIIFDKRNQIIFWNSGNEKISFKLSSDIMKKFDLNFSYFFMMDNSK